MKLLIATHNNKKKIELQRILSPLGIEVVTAEDIGCDLRDVEEAGTTFEENAKLKAVAGCEDSGIACIADDSGLCVDYLNGEPGVYSARYSGIHGDDEANIDKLLKNLENVPKEKIISGIPFYTRLWKTNASGEVSSEAIGMDKADQILSDYKVTAGWSSETSQDYAEFTDEDGNFCQIWLENEASIEEKMKLVQEYGLAGVAEWKLGFERSSIWDVIAKYVN